MTESITLAEYDYKACQALPAGGTANIKLSVTRGEEIIKMMYSGDGITNAAGFVMRVSADNLVVTGRMIYSDVFGNNFQTGFAFFTNLGTTKFLKPVHRLPAFEALAQSAVPASVVEDEPSIA